MHLHRRDCAPCAAAFYLAAGERQLAGFRYPSVRAKEQGSGCLDAMRKLLRNQLEELQALETYVARHISANWWIDRQGDIAQEAVCELLAALLEERD